jgi:asparagine synthase (glutamine-hydrolysing)
MSDPSALPVFMMMKAASSHGKVMLSGDGGDEVFGGYNRYRKILRESTRPMAKIGDYLAGFVGTMENRMMRRYLDEIFINSVSEVEKLLLPDFLPEEMYTPLDRRVMFSETRDPLTQWQELDLQTYLVDDNLKKTDRMSMWHSLEVRVPFVDRRIVEFGLSLPQRLRRHKETGKRILRHCLRERLPQNILSRKKVGFKVPLRSWLRDGEAVSLIQRFSDPHEPIWQVVHREVGMSWLRDHSTGKRNCEAQLWNLIVLNEWLRQYI